MNVIPDSLLKSSFFSVPILFFLVALADGFTYHSAESWFHDYKYTAAYTLPFVAAVIYFVYKFAQEKHVAWLRFVCVVIWILGIMLTVTLFWFSHSVEPMTSSPSENFEEQIELELYEFGRVQFSYPAALVVHIDSIGVAKLSDPQQKNRNVPLLVVSTSTVEAETFLEFAETYALATHAEAEDFGFSTPLEEIDIDGFKYWIGVDQSLAYSVVMNEYTGIPVLEVSRNFGTYTGNERGIIVWLGRGEIATMITGLEDWDGANDIFTSVRMIN